MFKTRKIAVKKRKRKCKSKELLKLCNTSLQLQIQAKENKKERVKCLMKQKLAITQEVQQISLKQLEKMEKAKAWLGQF